VRHDATLIEPDRLEKYVGISSATERDTVALQRPTIRIFAIDVGEERHEITTDTMLVKAVNESHEYAVARGRGVNTPTKPN
jgi:hypothetical protein